jgi:hypothetical protein
MCSGPLRGVTKTAIGTVRAATGAAEIPAVAAVPTAGALGPRLLAGCIGGGRSCGMGRGKCGAGQKVPIGDGGCMQGWRHRAVAGVRVEAGAPQVL